jgi:AAA15 family ATPase/GTPase
MYLQKIRIQNFKSYENIIFHFNYDINIFTGANNSGKTTVLEAIALWNECFDKLLTQAGKADKKKNLKKGDFVLGGSQPKYIAHTEIGSVHSPAYQDIFHNLKTSEPITLTAELLEPNSNQKIVIPFQIRAARGNLYEISLENYHNYNFNHFNIFFKKLPETINLTYASPVSNLKSVEDFETLPKIKLLTHSRASVAVLRNRIYQLKKNPTLYLEFINNLQYIINNGSKEKGIHFDFIGDETQNTQLIINIQIGAKDIPKEIALLGSGTLQIIEILLSLYESEKEFNLILLDEPDSHIHRDIQKRLLEIFIKFSDNTQIFITTHNESFIRSAAPQYLFHLEAKPINEYQNISFNLPAGIKKGFQPTPYLNIINSISGGNGLDFINALESDKIIFVEGEDDAKYISILLKSKIKQQHLKYVYWSFEGITNIYTHILSYKDIFNAIKNRTSLWQKSVLIFDKDFLTVAQKEILQTKLSEKLNIPIYIGQSYTFESSILTDIPKFKDSIYRYLVHQLKDSPPNSHDIDAYADAEIQKIIVQKQLYFDNDAGLDNWARTQNGLRKKLSNPPLKIELWRKDEFTLRTDFKLYAQSVLSISAIHQLANKDDVEAIIHGICQNYGLNFTIAGDFAELLTMIVQEKTNWFSAWDNLIKLF